MAVDKLLLDQTANFEHPLYRSLLQGAGLTVSTGVLDDLCTWGLTNALWIFPMATSCCGIEFMAAAASRVDLDRMGTIVRATPRQADVMVVAGTITTKMAPRVKKLWEQMPEPKWCIAMGSCAISGDFYRNLYSVVPGVDTFIPVDVYVPGCPPNPEALMHGMLRLQELVKLRKAGEQARAADPELMKITDPSVHRLNDPRRPAELSLLQEKAAETATDEQLCPPLVVEPQGEVKVPPLVGADFEALLKELGVAELPKDGPPVVPADKHLELARRLKSLGYRLYVSCVATHFPKGKGRKGAAPEENEHFEVTTLLRTPARESKLAAWAVRLEPEQPILTLTGVFAGADWQEREQYDLVGVRFAGHPDLRRLMMAEDYPHHPLRKDFAADSPAAPWR
jgi:NADH-quinone oxidoreductase subunit B/C/D